VVSAVLPTRCRAVLVDPAKVGGRLRTFDNQRGAQIDLDKATGELLATVSMPPTPCGSLSSTRRPRCARIHRRDGEALRLTTDYLKTRKQFGVTLSKFQTLTQRAANMYVCWNWRAA